VALVDFISDGAIFHGRSHVKKIAFLAFIVAGASLAAPAFSCPPSDPYCVLAANGPSQTGLRATAGAPMTVTGGTVRAVVLPSGARVAARHRLRR
jgi:hypothetical protein